MAILDSLTRSTSAASSTLFAPRGQQAAADRPKATVWLNIGYPAGDKFINLPIGLPVDTMDAIEVRGQNEDWVKQTHARNAFLKDLQNYGAGLKPGEEVILNPESMIQIRLRRTNDKLDVKSEDNEYAVDLGSLLSANRMAAE